jgi:topoisomerase IA-like protein
MKCLCGYNQKPENIKILERHISDCRSTGYLKDSGARHHIVWKDGEFAITEEVTKDDLHFETVTDVPGIYVINETLDTSDYTAQKPKKKASTKKPAAAAQTETKKTTTRRKAPVKKES